MKTRRWRWGGAWLLVLSCGLAAAHAQVLLDYSSFLGGNGDDSAQGVAIAPDGCIWVCGYTYSTNFPVVNPIQGQRQANQDAFVSKFSPDGGTLLFSTYLGGSSGASLAMGIAVDGEGNAYVCGYTEAANFPTLNAFQPARDGWWTDAFICKLDASGTLIYSSYLGGSMFDYSYDVAVDTAGCAYVAGRAWSTNFPTVNAFQPTNKLAGGYNFTLSKVAADGASLVYSTYLGGTGAGHEYSRVAVTPAGVAYFCGATTSTDYPVTPDAYQAAHAGPSPNSWDAVVSILSADGSTLLYSTFFGGAEDIDQAVDIAIGDDGSFTLVGITQSDDLPVVNPIQAAISGQPDLFVTRFAPDGQSLEFSTYLGGWDWDYGKAVAVDPDGSVVALGLSVSPNFPVYRAFQPANAGSYEAVVARLSPDGSALEYSTYLGGSGSEFGQAVALDADGNAVVVGQTQSANFPTAMPWQAAKSGGGDAFVARLAPPDWSQINANGFGEANNFSAFSLAVYGNRLYAGTWNNVDGCGIWRWDGPGTGDWTQVNVDGFGTADNRGAHSMAVYDGRLYVGTANNTDGFEVWAYNGSTWSQVANNGLGDAANTWASAMVVHDGKLIVASSWQGAVFSFDGGSWVQENANGFGNANNTALRSLAVYDGHLYAGTYNTTDYAELYRYDGPTAADWTLVAGGGFGGNFVEFRSLAACDGKLFIGASGWSTSCQVWEYDGASLVRNDPGAAMQYDAARCMTVFRGKLYVGTGNDSGTPTGGQVWSYDAAADVWQQINENGFGDAENKAVHCVLGHGNALFAGVANSAGVGGKVFRMGWKSRIDRVVPETGSLGGGYPVAIDGWNLTDGTVDDVANVTLCGVPATVQSAAGTTQIVVAAGTAVTTGTGDVRVFSASCGETVKSNAFTYEGGAITNVAPGAANVGGGIEVVIQGVALGNGADITVVTLAGVGAAIVTQGVDEVTVMAGAAPATATGDVQVTSTSGGTVGLADAFEYLWLDPPEQLDPAEIRTTSFLARWETVPAAATHLLDVGMDTNFSAYLPGYSARDVGTATTHRVAGLAQGTGYATRLFAWNADGFSWPSRTIWTFTALATAGDMDGDGVADPLVYQPAPGAWDMDSSTGTAAWLTPWGGRSMLPVPADYDGDGTDDFALYQRSTGYWYILYSSGGSRKTLFGAEDRIPLPGDYDGDGRADLATYSAADARWAFEATTAGPFELAFGGRSMVPVPADYDGDGAIDVAVYRPSTGVWYILYSGGGARVAQLGWATTVPVPADYDGDGKADLAVLNRPTSNWCIQYSGGDSLVVPFGYKTMTPVPADYDGDGLADIAMYHAASGTWYVRDSFTGAQRSFPLGGPDQIPAHRIPLLHSWYGLPWTP
jgi:hypothetical protein